MDIFVIDDEPVIAQTTSEILRMSGYSARAFTDPREALEAANLGCPRLLIVDLKMPGISGLELAVQIREVCADCRVILFTGQFNVSESIEQARESGFQFSVVFKPVSPVDLVTAVAKILG